MSALASIHTPAMTAELEASGPQSVGELPWGAIHRQVPAAQGGLVSVESPPGQGATFTVALPHTS